ncbi:hypothetical protein CROQUDRAFT_100721 [Cronartium quercuum f. sp. fusiforme G11]|uniref:Uncharacterized protein n=1 Tax=Cronartium quercuum f. sp. fusiforme G11 TaxID=708437 RepID=A0A9P6N9P5_9BASI|nr:hypothetical protein CROQUDRAFT_100721 [Cronartium quercuum f. sp. fusiforme G11]
MNGPTDTVPPNLSTVTTTPQQINEGGLIFQPGGLNVQQTVGLPAFLHKNEQELQGTIPLTAIDPRWQEEAANWQAKRWLQNSILKDLTSIRAVFAQRLPGTAVPNPGVWQPRVLEEVLTQARVLGETTFDNNPYATKGPREGYDTTTGLPKSTTSNQGGTDTSTSSFIPPSFMNQKYHIMKSKGGHKMNSNAPSGYKGKRYDPNYKKPYGKKEDGDKGKGKDKDKDDEM